MLYIGLCWSSIWCILVSICWYQPPNLPRPPFLFGNQTFVFHVCKSVSIFLRAGFFLNIFDILKCIKYLFLLLFFCQNPEAWSLTRDQTLAPAMEVWSLNHCSAREVLVSGALGRARGTGWRGRWEGGYGWGIHVNPWLIHVNVWQKPLQYCKVISLQLIKINEKKSKKKNKMLKKKKRQVLVSGLWKWKC